MVFCMRSGVALAAVLFVFIAAAGVALEQIKSGGLLGALLRHALQPLKLCFWRKFRAQKAILGQMKEFCAYALS